MDTDARLTDALLDELHALAIEVAQACGRLLVDERPDNLGVAATKASATDVVTEMDRRSEELAREMLQSRRPDDGLFGEEGMNEQGTSGITWVVDPIDGTVNYLYGIPVWAVSVAAVVGDPHTNGAWEPVASAVHNVSAQELFHARHGAGAFLRSPRGERQLRCAPAGDLEHTLVATGFAYTAELRDWQGRIVSELLPQVRDIRRLGSAALDFCHVAAGRVDAYYETDCKQWDVAGGWLVATEAGAVVRGLEGDFPTRRLLAVGSRETADFLADFMAARDVPEV